MDFHYSIDRICQPPFATPSHTECAVFAKGSDKLCQVCQDPGHDEDGPPSDVSCRCMGGSRPTARAVFTVVFTRPFGRLALSVFLPPLAIIIVNQAVFFMRVETSETRMSMCGSALLSS